MFSKLTNFIFSPCNSFWNQSIDPWTHPFSKTFLLCVTKVLDIVKSGGDIVKLDDISAAFSIVVHSFFLEMHFSPWFPGCHTFPVSPYHCLILLHTFCWSYLIFPSSQCWLPQVSVLGPLLFMHLYCGLIQSHGFQGRQDADNFSIFIYSLDLPLNSRSIHPKAYSTYPLGCLMSRYVKEKR